MKALLLAVCFVLFGMGTSIALIAHGSVMPMAGAAQLLALVIALCAATCGR